MKRLTASILALGLAASVGTASAQSSGYYSQYGQPNVDRYGQAEGAYYDYARVVRVDPVLQSGYGYPTSSSQRCYTRQDGYVANDPYYNGNGYYGGNNNGYYGNGNGYYGGNSNDYYGNGNGYYGNGNNGYYGNGSATGRTVATVIGGVLGAAIGSQVGGGSARYATSAIGSMVGGMAGRQVYESSQRNRYPRTAQVTVCDPVPVNGGYYPANDAYNNGVSAYDVTYDYGGRRYTTRTNYHPGNRIRVRVDVRPE